MAAEPSGQPALAPGERVLARLQPAGPGRYEGRTMRRLTDTPGRVLGVYRQGRIIPTDRRAKGEWTVPPGEDGGAEPGEIVLADQDPQVVLRDARDGLVVLGSVGFFDQFRVAIGGSARAVAVEYPDADRDAENPDAENPDASPSASALS